MSVFSFIYLIENLKKHDNFGLFYKKKWQEFQNFEDFIPLFLKKIFLKRSQGFFNYLRPKKVIKFHLYIFHLNN